MSRRSKQQRQQQQQFRVRFAELRCRPQQAATASKIAVVVALLCLAMPVFEFGSSSSVFVKGFVSSTAPSFATTNRAQRRSSDAPPLQQSCRRFRSSISEYVADFEDDAKDVSIQSQQPKEGDVNDEESEQRTNARVPNIIMSEDRVRRNITPKLISSPSVSTATSQQAIKKKHVRYFPELKIWALRLDTVMDKMDAHKLSSLVFCVSSSIIAGVGISCAFSEVPDSLQVPTWMYFVSSCILGVTSVDMVYKYRAKDEIAKTGFINVAIVLVALGWAAMYEAPFAPEIFNNVWFGNGIVAMTNAPTVVIGFRQLRTFHEIINHSRRGGSKDDAEYDSRRLVTSNLLSYGIVTLVGFGVALAAAIILLDPSHDRNWVIESSAQSRLPHGKLFMTYNYYSSVMGSIAAGYGSFAVTLFDKKLIPQIVEQRIIGFLCVLFLLLQLMAFGIF